MRLASFAPFVTLLLLLGCDRAPSEGVKEWTPADHDRLEEQQRAMAGGQPASAPPKASAQPDDGTTLAETVWAQRCAACHGPTGKGDGPTGPMVGAPDLTRPDLQAKATDEQIAAIIKNGKGKMPKFDLPDSVVNALVRRVRAVRAGARP